MRKAVVIMLTLLVAGCGWNVERVPYYRFDPASYCHDPQAGVVRSRERGSIAWRQHFLAGNQLHDPWNRYHDPAWRNDARSVYRDRAERFAPSYLYHRPYSVWAHQLDQAQLQRLPICGQLDPPS